MSFVFRRLTKFLLQGAPWKVTDHSDVQEISFYRTRRKPPFDHTLSQFCKIPTFTSYCLENLF